jgi:GMP synthase (glutamine-hydrolysing)
MICFVSMEHESWLESPEARAQHLAFCMDVKLKLEEISGQPCLVQRYTEVTQQQLQELGIEALLFSGNGTDWVHYDKVELAKLFNIVRQATWPILGFCGGHQIAAMAHGATVAPMRRLRPGEPDVTTLSRPGYLKEWGFMPVDVVKADPIFDGLGKSPVFLQVHYCEVKELPPGFEVLASSKECPIQAMKQIDKPVYGVQFHPEAYTDRPYDRRNSLVNLVYPEGHAAAQTDGRTLLTNFFRIARVLT